ncbi:MAG: porin family protein [Pricia sp.]
MKIKLVALFTLLTMGALQVNAQVIEGTSGSVDLDGIRFGPKLGFHVSSFSGDDFVNINTKAGGYIGGIAEIPAFFDAFYFQPELLLSLKGADVGPGNLNLYYLQLPLMAKYHITDAIAVELGPQVGFLISDNGDKEPLSNVNPNGVDVGMNIGGGYLLNDTFYFQLRFEAGLSRILDNRDLRNRAVSIGASYFF